MATAELQRTQQIENLMDSRWRDFDGWVSTADAYQTLAIPQEVSGVFLPRRLLELSLNPENLRVIVKQNEPEHLLFIVYEYLDMPLSDPEMFDKWKGQHPERYAQVVNMDELVETTPQGIDYKHVKYHDHIERGILSLNDKIFLEYSADLEAPTLTKPPYPHLVQTRSYIDREDIQRQGVGTSFYQRLEEILKRLGFKYLSGQIISSHPGFFAKTRIKYDDLPASIKEELPEHYEHSEPEWMIRVL